MTKWTKVREGCWQLPLSDAMVLQVEQRDGGWFGTAERKFELPFPNVPAELSYRLCELSSVGQLDDAQCGALANLLHKWHSCGLPLSKGEHDVAKEALRVFFHPYPSKAISA